mgnify:FL=1
MSLKRIINELNRDWTTLWQERNSIFITNNRLPRLQFLIFFQCDYEPIMVTMDFNSIAYPFRPPKVFIGLREIDYISLLPTTWKFQQKILGQKCLCCNSILCKWAPNKTIMDIVNEVKENFELKIRMMEIAHCKKIVEKKLGVNYLPIEEFL